MLIKSIIFIQIIYFVSSLPSSKRQAPPDNRVLYDQRQEGEWNVRADLKNFVFLIVPSSPSTVSPSSVLDFLVRSVPKRSQLKKKNQEKEVPVKDAAEETQHFIESKTAPYHVDISTTRSHLAKLHPEPLIVKGEDIVIAKSPSIALIKDNKTGRIARTLLLSLRSERSKKVDKKDSKKKY